MNRKVPRTIPEHIIDTLKDGRRRSREQLVNEIVEKTGCSVATVGSTLSTRTKYDQRVRRTRENRMYYYEYVGRPQYGEAS